MRFAQMTAAALATLIPLTVIAQTSTDCDPTKKTCPKDVGLNNAAFTSHFTKGESAFASWSAADGTSMKFGDQGAEFGISQSGQAPTVQSDFYIFFGRVDVNMRAAPGTGIVSSIVFESDDLDEIDWEFLGGNTAQVETNFFGKGNTTSYDRAIYYPVSTPQNSMHTYTVDWNSDRIEWIIDGKTVRTLTRNDPSTVGGKNYPQTPMRVKLGSWCGGCDGEPKGTVDWAGGKTTFDDAPYMMYVESVNIQNYNPADAYEYSDRSGSWQSIKLIKDGSSAEPSGAVTASATAIGAGDNNTVAPTSSLPVSDIKNTNAAVSTTIKGGNSSMTGTGGGSIKTSTSLTTVPGETPTGAGANPAESSPGMQNSGAALSLVTSASVLGVLFSLLLL